jgi:hypothetical protein
VEADRLFLHTLGDLARRATATDEYAVLMGAGLLRKLLVDGGRLMDQVNRHHRLQVRFRIGGESPLERHILASNPLFWAIEDALDPDCPLAYVPIEVSVDKLLARRIMRYGGRWITVHDVIDQLANVEGAVHSGEPRNQHQRLLQAAGRFYSRGGLPGVVSQVGRISRIAVAGLDPLRAAVVAGGAATFAAANQHGVVELRADAADG